MSNERFVAVVRPRTAEENGGGKRPWARWESERPSERDLRFGVREGKFLFLVGIRLYGVLRAEQLEKLVGALKIELLLDAVLCPASSDGRFCGVERAIINAAHHGDLKMKGGVLLANSDGR
jgi:hypothetical protein